MSKAAKVGDIEALKRFRLALIAFAEKANSAIGEADAEVQRVAMWLENEQSTYWASELRKRHAAVMKAKDDLRYKQVFKSPTGGRQSTVDEEKALSIALRRHAEAEQKAANVKKWIRQLDKESHLYRGSMQRLATTVSVDLPNAAAKISRMAAALEGYVALSAPNLGHIIESTEAAGVSRGAAGLELGAGYKALRQNTPTSDMKDKAGPANPTAPWSAGEFAPDDAAAIEKNLDKHEPIDPASSVILAGGVYSVRRIYLERGLPAFPGDSGWYIGPADASPAERYESMTVGDILKVRPHFAQMLTLPLGSLVVIDSAGIAALLNASDEDIW